MKTRHPFLHAAQRAAAAAAAATAILECLPLIVLVACSKAPEDEAPSRQPIPTATTTSTIPDGGDAPDAACFGPGQCFKCEPVQLVEFLNACTDGKCIPFDNAARLPLFKAGEPLPPVP